jgi:hypothetical protein
MICKEEENTLSYYPMLISALNLIQQLRTVVNTFPDSRSDRHIRYSMEDIVLGGFSVFLTQSASFLSFQRTMQEQTGRNNGTSLFGIGSLPGDDQIRRVLDTVSPALVFPVFMRCFEELKTSGDMKEFKSALGYLVALDGTQYFSSSSIFCENCLQKTDHKTKHVTFSHTAITPVIVKPGSEHVFSLVPEYIIPQDGHQKQDCENAAAKRWLSTYGRKLSSIEQDTPTIILGDDLYSRQPVIEAITAQGLTYILVCKKESHPWLYDYVEHLDTGKKDEDMHTLTIRKWNGTTAIHTTYQFAQHVPLKESADSLVVNWCGVEVRCEKTGKLLYHNAFITPLEITEENVATIVTSGRARWKIENENNNTLKTKGYYFEHNYGHGEANLSMVLTTLILIAFLFHTLFSLFWQPYMHILARIKRQRVFESIRVLSQYYFAPTWEHLFAGMEYALDNVVLLPTPFSLLPAG